MSDEASGGSIESAVTRLSGLLAPEKKPDPAAAPEFSPEASAELATPENQSPTGDTEPQEIAPIGDEQTNEPAEGQPIDAPVSWDADAKAKFQSLPRDVQEYVTKRENERNAEVRRVQNEAAKLRQSFEAERTQGTSQLQNIRNYLTTLTGALQTQVAGEFSDIKSREDVSRLAAENPGRYVLWRDKMDLLEQASAAQNQFAAQQQQEYEYRRGQLMQEGQKRLAESVPDLMADNEAGAKNRNELKGYLQKNGYTDAEISSVVDHRAFSVAWKAYKYDQAMARQASAKKAGVQVPTVVRPGTSSGGRGNGEAFQAARQSLRKSGSVDDAARALSRIL